MRPAQHVRSATAPFASLLAGESVDSDRRRVEEVLVAFFFAVSFVSWVAAHFYVADSSADERSRCLVGTFREQVVFRHWLVAGRR